MTNAAGQIWPNLKSDEPPKQQQRASSPLAEALYPSLVPQVKPRDDWRERYLQKLRQNLREAIDTRRR